MDIQSSSVTPYQKLLSMLGDNFTPKATETTALDSKVAASEAVKVLDTVELSAAGVRLQKISQEFFSGTIHSSQIPALTQRLYEEGFLTTSQFQSLGGHAKTTNAVQEATSFLNNYASSAMNKGLNNDASLGLNAAKALANMNKAVTPESRQAELEAKAWVEETLAKLQAEQGDTEIVQGFAKVLEVFNALDKVRASTNANALNHYQQVQDAYDEADAKK